MKEEKSWRRGSLRRESKGLEVLLVRHRNGSHWSFPKGHVEQGEQERQTALAGNPGRDRVGSPAAPRVSNSGGILPKPGVWKQVVYFAGLPAGGVLTPQEEEIRELRWISACNAMEMVTYENDRQVLSKALAFVQERSLSLG